ncbi:MULTISPECIES: translation initiation factor IF-2 [Mesotoga]|uniref:translation initiation factor IF-2 n=2 Tax=Kosmotogaceae TaxID=1643948 RepID=UPI0002CBA24F|nr:translation initiation factor IF-2 [Thermotogota bacterium]MCP5460328.1 translation initiation factor IF-2 [Thermotogota bacterium]MDK2943584.1 translation initiation factor [Mesotoga sp.]CCU83870.1 Translation initiation factor IF-2 [Mesotoga infera]
MPKARVYELAKRLNITARELLDELEELGVTVKNHMSVLDEETVNIIVGLYEEEKKETLRKAEKAKSKIQEKEAKKLEKKLVSIEEPPTEKKIPVEHKARTIKLKSNEFKLDVLAKKMNVPISKVIKDQFMNGIILRPGQILSLEDAMNIAKNYEWEVELIHEQEINPFDAIVSAYSDAYKESSRLVQRPPVVTVMGHVDHGKTTLLDRIRKAKVAEDEIGGITQTIGAYQVEIRNKKITFIDTPGHEAFTEMRARGAQATDIVVLVVAADDGVMPQTIEAYNHAKTANVPIIVAINKIDKPNANVDLTKQQLASKLGLVPEDWGGDTVMVPVSAKTGKGVEDVLEMILLVAEVADIKCIPEGNARGIIIDSRLDKAVGPLATLVIKDGVLKPGSYVVAGSASGRVKALINEYGKRVKEANPSDPVQIIGFDEVPDVHSIVYAVDDLDTSRSLADFAKSQAQKEKSVTTKRHVRLEEFLSMTGTTDEKKELKLILKADSFGTVEALKQAMAKLENSDVKIEVVHSGIGSVNSSDVMLASASDAVIMGFKVKPDAMARKQAEVEGVQIKVYEIIFNLIDDLKKALEGLLEPEEVDEVIGHGHIKQLFKISKVGTIAGVQINDGYVLKKGKMRVYRRNEEVADLAIEVLKHYKDDVSRVDAPKECGIKAVGFDDFQEEDQLEFHSKKSVKRTIDFTE